MDVAVMKKLATDVLYHLVAHGMMDMVMDLPVLQNHT
jgi:hypothetical protein